MVLPASLINTTFTHEYHLSSVLLHAGTTTVEGHYTTSTKQHNGAWLLHDDDKPAEQISLDDMGKRAFGGQSGTCACLLLHVCQNVCEENIDALHNCEASHAAVAETGCETNVTCGLPNVHNGQVGGASSLSQGEDTRRVSPNNVSYAPHEQSARNEPRCESHNHRLKAQIKQRNGKLRQCKSRRAKQQQIITSIVTRLRADKIKTRRTSLVALNMAKKTTACEKNANIVSPPVGQTIMKKTAKRLPNKKKATKTSPRLHHNHATATTRTNGQLNVPNNMAKKATSLAKNANIVPSSVDKKIMKKAAKHGAKTSFKQKKRALSQHPKLSTKKKKPNNGLTAHKSAATKGTKGKRSLTQPKLCTKKKKTHTNSVAENMSGHATVNQQRCCNYSLCVHI